MLTPRATRVCAWLRSRRATQRAAPLTRLARRDLEVVSGRGTSRHFDATRSLYIRDLYVTRRLRGCGVGTALVKAGARLTLREGFSALEWTTETANAAARGMYEACGARQLDRTYYRLFDDTLAAAAS